MIDIYDMIDIWYVLTLWGFFSHLILDPCIFQAGALKRFIPLFDRVLIERVAAETQTKGGVLIPEKAQAKVQTGTVVAVGPGSRADVCF